jgi:ABC-type nitrate/sulfonate/bicarbonate transport system substrate-binding protein
LLTVGLADIRGVRVTYLFNLFDFWGAVVTSRPDVKTLKDLEGKDLAAAKGTTNYVMFDWFARQLGADTAKFSVINTATPRSRRLRACRSRGRRPALGAGLYHPAVEEERYANDRP